MLLLGLLALPVLWILLRAAPPAPLRRRFPGGVALLLGLEDRQKQADRTPWWLLLLRMVALAAAIVGFAGPILNPVTATHSDRPLLILSDASWASAADGPRIENRIRDELESARAAGRPPVALAALSREIPDQIRFGTAEDVLATLPEMAPPRAWDARPLDAALLPEGRFDTLWLSDGLARPDRAALLQALQARGQVRVAEQGGMITALAPPAQVVEGALSVDVRAPRAWARLLRSPPSGWIRRGLSAIWPA